MAQHTRSDDSGGGTHTLGLLYPPAGRLGDYTTMQLAFVGGVAEAAAEHGYDLLLAPAGTHEDPSFPRMIDDRRVDGVIVMEIRREDDRVERLADAGFPFVAIGRNHRADAADWVDLDFAGLAGGCVQHLADLGHRRIAFVNRSEQLFDSGYGFARLGDEGYTEMMKKLLLTPHAYLCGDDLASGSGSWSGSWTTTRRRPRWSPRTKRPWKASTADSPGTAAACRATSPSSVSPPAPGPNR